MRGFSAKERVCFINITCPRRDWTLQQREDSTTGLEGAEGCGGGPRSKALRVKLPDQTQEHPFSGSLRQTTGD